MLLSSEVIDFGVSWLYRWDGVFKFKKIVLDLSCYVAKRFFKDPIRSVEFYKIEKFE